MALLKWLIVATAAFGGLVALMYVAQRSLMYFPERLHTVPAVAGLAEAQELALQTKDGETVIVWHVPPRGEKPVVLYFHGNGGALRYRVDRFRALIADGNGLVALSYRAKLKGLRTKTPVFKIRYLASRNRQSVFKDGRCHRQIEALRPARAGGVCSRSGKYINERCTKYMNATSPHKVAVATISPLANAMAHNPGSAPPQWEARHTE